MEEGYDMNLDLFQSVDFKSHAGLDLNWKIEMDALSDDEWFTIARMILEHSVPFHSAIGIPRGGVKLGELLNMHGTNKEEDPICIVDDVLTTGMSMNEYKEGLPLERWQKSLALGWVVFARVKPPKWINALFQMPH